MKSFRTLLLAAVVTASFLALGPSPANAQDYWNGYWGWYDSTYAPGYGRYYSSSRPYYGAYYSSPYYSPPYYGPSYYGPGAGVQVYGRRAAVNVGPVRFGWW